ncbi:hypothetical protein ACFOOM_13930 [Streptomyces echinoruber]|uniref:Uncharacterized protein n=1 Tax=Streptomyces echinoruber TaxID=68898 RepID=A0A918RE85_9ACTN|nr:hypothetical protein [Streptomyces echinoruber]GGZ95105.1 hypothetical protein GCM10010389_37530 [Streptomyces echinoruber]
MTALTERPSAILQPRCTRRGPPQFAEHLVATVRAWDRHVRAEDNRQYVDPILTVHPAGRPDEQVPPGDLLDKEHGRLVIRWPGREAQRVALGQLLQRCPPHVHPAIARRAEYLTGTPVAES